MDIKNYLVTEYKKKIWHMPYLSDYLYLFMFSLSLVQIALQVSQVKLILTPGMNELTDEHEQASKLKKKQLNSVASIRERTTPTERPPLVG
jgi:hypothetical protein